MKKFIVILSLLFSIFAVAEEERNLDEIIHLYKLIEEGDLEEIKTTIEEKPELINVYVYEDEFKKYTGLTPLSLAIIKRKEEIIDNLLENGADPNYTEERNIFYYAPIEASVEQCNIELTKKLIEHGSDLLVDDVIITGALLSLPMQINCKNEEDSEKLWKLLTIDIDFDMTHRDRYGRNILYYAYQDDKTAPFNIISGLLKKGVDINSIIFDSSDFPNSREPSQDTLLTYAIKDRNIGLIQFLLTQKNSNLTLIRNEKGQTPRQLAIILGYSEVMELLKDYL